MSSLKIQEKRYLNKKEQKDLFFPIFSNVAHNSIEIPTYQLKPQLKQKTHHRYMGMIPKMEELEDNSKVNETNYSIPSFSIDESIILPDVSNDSCNLRKNSIEVKNKYFDKENIVRINLISKFLKLIDRMKMEPR